MSSTFSSLNHAAIKDRLESLLPPSLLQKISFQAERLARYSWEYGTVFHAFLQLYDPELSIFNNSQHLQAKLGFNYQNDNNTSIPRDVRALKYIRPFINTSEETCEELFYDPDGAAGDPPSLGIAACMIGGEEYMKAVDRQLNFLLTKVPRWSESEHMRDTGQGRGGAISHRKNVAELWADSVFMVPPFLAYAGAMKGDITLAKEAVNQIKAYREVLLRRSDAVRTGNGERESEGSSKGWMHIVGPENEDLEFWSTGCGWVALGIAFVAAILRKWPVNSAPSVPADFVSILIRYGEEIIDGIISIDKAINALPKHDTETWNQKDEALLRNYIDDPSWFPEVAGTASIVAAVYRMAFLISLHLDCNLSLHRYREWAEEKYRAISLNCIDQQTGLVTPVVNALNHRDRTPLASGTAEAQCFVLMMEAARRDYYRFEAMRQGRLLESN